jgi:hypothetical protein
MSHNLNWQRLKSKGWFGLSSEDVSDRSPYVRGTNDINCKSTDVWGCRYYSS